MPERPQRIAGLLSAVVLLFLFLPVQAQFDQAGYDEAARTILCDCGCHPQSIHDCACGRAAEMRREVAGLIEGGMTGEQVVARYVEEHGEQIRIAPKAEGFNLLAWLGPFVVLVAMSLLLVLVMRRWMARRPAPQTAPAVTAAAPGTASVEDNAAYMARIERQLEEMD